MEFCAQMNTATGTAIKRPLHQPLPAKMELRSSAQRRVLVFERDSGCQSLTISGNPADVGEVSHVDDRI
ncbi:hypothetical protein CGGC5_v017043 [Colletotrichum fructicola Nara gc5]|uniref:Uncharacterized protein n=1 Tax=Colletotrichum fructicola (strain Nara gc5) TaxID=1213859 RepID=A0A7J6IFF2_COLFN|nr:hypothetical protein CGGC5_v017043 [Colletotrichum fructicola Nara gc5]